MSSEKSIPHFYAIGVSPGGKPNRESGFTFAETLAAMLFVALVIPVALHGIAIANRAGVIADRKIVAVQLAERFLDEMILNESWSSCSTRGDFGEEWPEYRWEFIEETWPYDDMQMLTVVVWFKVQEHEYHVLLSTLVEESETS
ncbi:MAG: type II secretion system protein [Candidatus Omnitrophota bacterium]|jgi:hypothetical protein|nr:MAG: type II secretion system protein [Candidatus Omnitrophota bacterium]